MLTALRTALGGGDECRLGRRGTFRGRFSVATWRWSVALCKFDDDPRWVLRLFCLWVHLGEARTPPKHDMLDKWGFRVDFGDRFVHLSWGHRYKILDLPWALEHCLHEVMLRDGSFVRADTSDGASPRRPMNPWTGDVGPDLWCQTYPYRYVLRSGDVQERMAMVTVGRRTWWWKWFYWLGWPRKARTFIYVKFSDEVGEQTGSWKGGRIGCGYELRAGETPESCLRRMEQDREFD